MKKSTNIHIRTTPEEKARLLRKAETCPECNGNISKYIEKLQKIVDSMMKLKLADGSEIKVKPCPFCGENHDLQTFKIDGLWSVQCGGCGGCGPACEEEEDCVLGWGQC